MEENTVKTNEIEEYEQPEVEVEEAPEELSLIHISEPTRPEP